MSLWTPDGERQVAGDRPDTATPGQAAPADAEQPLSPEQEEQARAMAKELADARARLLETEVSTVLTNHALGIYELAAIHLTADEPDLVEAKLAIDGLAALVDGLQGRLGDGEPTLRDALQQAQMAFVQRRTAAEAAASAPADPA